MIFQFSYCSNLKVPDLIFALQILLCGAGEGLTELSSLLSLIFLWQWLETERNPSSELMLLSVQGSPLR